jgi:dethiobiotin synthetase
LAGWVANRIEPAMARLDANLAALDERLPAPRIAIVDWGKADAPEWAPGAAVLEIG